MLFLYSNKNTEGYHMTSITQKSALKEYAFTVDFQQFQL